MEHNSTKTISAILDLGFVHGKEMEEVVEVLFQFLRVNCHGPNPTLGA